MKMLPRLVASLFFAAGLAQAESTLPSKPLVVGESAPDVIFHDEHDQPVGLRDLVRQKPTVLVFYRGGWCPFCMRHLAALAEIQQDIFDAGFQLVAVSADQPSLLAKTPSREKLSYTLLSDNTMTAAKAFGIAFEVPTEMVKKYKESYKIDLEASSGLKHHLLLHPSVFIFDRNGVIRFAHVNPDYKVRPTGVEIMQAIKSGR